MTFHKKFIQEFTDWFELIFVRSLPNSFLGNKIRKYYWKLRVKNLGTNPLICRMAQIEVPSLVKIGNNLKLGDNAIINPGDSKGIFIGNDVSIASNSFLRAANHSFDRTDIPISNQGHTFSVIQYNNCEYSIVIEDDVWLGYNVVLVSGANIGKGSVIATGSVVSNNIPPYSIVVGNPGRVIGNRMKKLQ
jgi:acetyltransferase-like isoleucine patch superfamily enzyme